LCANVGVLNAASSEFITEREIGALRTNRRQIEWEGRGQRTFCEKELAKVFSFGEGIFTR